MNAVLEQISKICIVPVVKIDRAEDALPLAKALCAGGLPCAEVTFRTDAAAEAIGIMTSHFPDMCVGAGTVLNTEQVDAAVAAGADGLIIEVHNDPARALSDGAQSLTYESFAETMPELRQLALAVGREL